MDQSYPYRKYSGLRMQQENTSRGGLQVTVLTEDGTRPVEDAVVRISYTGEPDRTVEEIKQILQVRHRFWNLSPLLWNTAWNHRKNSLMPNILFR